MLIDILIEEFERKKIAEKAAQLQKSGAELTEAIAQSARLMDEMVKAEAHLAEVQTKHDRVRTECELRENERSKMVEENAVFIAALEGELLKQEQEEAELDEKYCFHYLPFLSCTYLFSAD